MDTIKNEVAKGFTPSGSKNQKPSVDQDHFLLDTNDVAQMLHLSKRTLQSLRSAGILPFVRPTHYRCYYHPVDVALVHHFIKSRKEARHDR